MPGGSETIATFGLENLGKILKKKSSETGVSELEEPVG
jgi:hypothetical protein